MNLITIFIKCLYLNFVQEVLLSQLVSFCEKKFRYNFLDPLVSTRALSIASSACIGWKLRHNKCRLDKEELT